MNLKQLSGNKSRRIKDSDDNWHGFSDADKQLVQSDPDGVYYVIGRDTFMSGWGGAAGTNSYMVVVCWSDSQMRSCLSEMEYAKEMRNVRHSYELPKRLRGRIDYYNFDDCTRFNKSYFYQLNRRPEYDKHILPHDADYCRNRPSEWEISKVRVIDLATNECVQYTQWSDGIDEWFYDGMIDSFSTDKGQYEVQLVKAKQDATGKFINGSEELVKSQVVGLGASDAGNVADSRKVSDAKRGKDVFTFEIFDDTEGEEITPMAYMRTYYDIDEAIADMEDVMQDYKDEPNTIYGLVYAGEYETSSGIFGEPNVVYEVCNRD